MNKHLFLISGFLMLLLIPFSGAAHYNVTVSEGLKVGDSLGGQWVDVSAKEDYNNFINKLLLDVFLFGFWLVFSGYLLTKLGKSFFKELKTKIILLMWVILSLIIAILLFVLKSKIITPF